MSSGSAPERRSGPHPVSLLACAAGKIDVDLSASEELAERAETVTVIPGQGVVAAGDDALDAVTRLEAAERLAEITLAVRRFDDH